MRNACFFVNPKITLLILTLKTLNHLKSTLVRLGIKFGAPLSKLNFYTLQIHKEEIPKH